MELQREPLLAGSSVLTKALSSLLNVQPGEQQDNRRGCLDFSSASTDPQAWRQPVKATGENPRVTQVGDEAKNLPKREGRAGWAPPEADLYLLGLWYHIGESCCEPA